MFYDNGTSTDYQSWTATDFTGDAISRNTEYTTLIPQDTFDSQYIEFSSSNFTIEFDLNITGISSHFLRLTTNMWTYLCQISQSEMEVNSGEWYHIKLVKTDSTVKVIVDEVEKISKLLSDSNCTGLRFTLSTASTTNLKYKNFKIYSI